MVFFFFLYARAPSHPCAPSPSKFGSGCILNPMAIVFTSAKKGLFGHKDPADALRGKGHVKSKEGGGRDAATSQGAGRRARSPLQLWERLTSRPPWASLPSGKFLRRSAFKPPRWRWSVRQPQETTALSCLNPVSVTRIRRVCTRGHQLQMTHLQRKPEPQILANSRAPVPAQQWGWTKLGGLTLVASTIVRIIISVYLLPASVECLHLCKILYIK